MRRQKRAAAATARELGGTDDKELVKFIARALADEPEEVEVHAADDQVIELRLAPDDVGRIIGRRGKTAKAIRTLLAVSGEGWDLDIAGHGEDEEDEDERRRTGTIRIEPWQRARHANEIAAAPGVAARDWVELGRVLAAARPGRRPARRAA